MIKQLHLIFAIVLLACPGLAWGNGMYIPEGAVPLMPAIPQQRAIIQYRNGIETLVVESTFESKSPNVAWILPVPAVPTKIEQVDPGVLTTMQICMGSRITHDLSNVVENSECIFVAVLAIALAVILNRQHVVFVVLFAIATILLLIAMLLPSLGEGGPAGAISGTDIQSSMQHIGNYDVAVLRPKEGGDVNAWLTQHGLAGLSREAVNAVQQYISEHWCFLVAKLGHDGSGPAAPHPLAVTFPAGAPVFPMRLTALANTTTRVDLFVIANQEARAAGFRCQAADRFAETPETDTSWARATADHLDISIGHPDILPLLYDGCVITRLTADLTPAYMTTDVLLNLSPLTPHRDHFFTEEGRQDTVLIILFAGLTVLAVIAVIMFRGHRHPTNGKMKVFTICLLVILVPPSGLFWLLPVAAARTGRDLSSRRMLMQFHYCRGEIRSLIAAGDLTPDTPLATVKKLPELMTQKHAPRLDYFTNPYTGRVMAYERSPGNFSMRTISGVPSICLYTPNGDEYPIPLVAPPTTQEH